MADRRDALDPGPDVTEIDDRADRDVPWRVFAGAGTVLGVMAVIYAATSREAAGVVMLAVATLLGLYCATFLWRASRPVAPGRGPGHPATGADGTDEAAFLPESSPWPFGIGLGATLVLNGLLIGTWFLVPGVMVLVGCLIGFARQSRHRYQR